MVYAVVASDSLGWIEDGQGKGGDSLAQHDVSLRVVVIEERILECVPFLILNVKGVNDSGLCAGSVFVPHIHKSIILGVALDANYERLHLIPATVTKRMNRLLQGTRHAELEVTMILDCGLDTHIHGKMTRKRHVPLEDVKLVECGSHEETFTSVKGNIQFYT